MILLPLIEDVIFQVTCVSESSFKKIRVITKLPNSEQSSKGKVKTHKYINRQNQSRREASPLPI